jgi:class 3 adenylate cyclase/tetratricopeptide (TPR) repeat protein
MECQSCHTANPSSNRYCENCGSALTYKCAACGFDCTPAARFCGGCGVPVPRAPLASAPRLASIAAAPSSGWGELKQATVLFADIVSSTEQIARLGPEEAMDRLQPAVMLMCEAVERYGGTVVRTLGDGIMALFGVPKALEGHARLACDSALHMQTLFAGKPQGFSIRVGLHSGLVASDPHAQDGGKGGGAHGWTIHLASRVVALASPGGVAMTEHCHALVRGTVEVESVGRPTLKGIPDPVEIFRLRGLKAAFASQHFHQAKLTQLRGREKELGRLQHAQALAEAGEAQVLGICGGPGTGKSRLCYEMAQWCRARGRPVFEVRAQLYGSATPLQPVLELMRVFLFGISDADAPAAAREKIALRLGELGPADESDLGLLNDFLGVAEPGIGAATLNAKARHARLLTLVRGLLRHAGSQPIVILIEDLHWLDDASEEFVATMVDAVVGTRILIVLNYRPQYISPWLELPYFEQIDLAELTAADTSALVRELISHRRELQDICQLIVQRSAGNPFFAEELVRSLAESGVLSAEPGSAAVRDRDSVENALPATVQAVIAARIDRLVEADKAILQTCAIIGKELPLAVLEGVVTHLGSAELERGLDSLCHAELLQPQPPMGGRRYAFRHPMIQEVAYGSQLKARRSSIHAKVAAVMEAHFEDRLDEFAALIAYHFDAAARPYEAARYEARAARWIGATNSAQAIKHWRKVWESLRHCPRSEDTDRLRTLAGGQIGVLGWREGAKFEEVKPVIDEAIELASGKDERLVQLLMIVDGRMQVSSGGSADAFVVCAQNALARTAPEDTGRAAMLNSLLSQALGWAGRIEEALAANTAAMEAAEHIDESDVAFVGFNIAEWLVAMRSRLLLKLGRHGEGVEHLRRHMTTAAATSDLFIRTVGHLGSVEFALNANDAAAAEHHAAALWQLAEKNQIPYLRVYGLTYSAMVNIMQDDHIAAQSKLNEALALARRANVALEFEPEILEFLADCHLRAGHPAEAARLAQECIALSRARGTRLAECRALITLSKARTAESLPHSAVQEVRDMLARASSLIAETGAAIYGNDLRGAHDQLAQSTAGISS